MTIGFVFHHTKPDHILLTHWLSDDLNNLPHYATHYVAAAGCSDSLIYPSNLST